MKWKILAVLAFALILAGCTDTGAGRTTEGGGWTQVIASGFNNPVYTLLNMSTYAVYGQDATFSRNVSALNFLGNFIGNATLGNYYNKTETENLGNLTYYYNKTSSDALYYNKTVMDSTTTAINNTAVSALSLATTANETANTANATANGKAGVGSCAANQWATATTTGAPTCLQPSTDNVTEGTSQYFTPARAATAVINTTIARIGSSAECTYGIKNASTTTSGVDVTCAVQQGTVTSVASGSGLTGGTITTTGTVSLNDTYVSVLMGNSTIARTGSTAVCSYGLANATSTTSGLAGTCASQQGTVTSVSCGYGMNASTITTSGTCDVNDSVMQNRISASCSYGINAIAQAGTVTCASQQGTVTSVTAGTGLTGGVITGAGTVALNDTYVATLMDNSTIARAGSSTTCSAGQWLVNVTSSTTGMAGVCTAIPTYNNGTVTSVTCGSGLTGGAITASGTCALNDTYVGTLVPVYNNVTAGSCSANQFMTAVTAGTAPSCAQPGFTNMSGSIAQSQIPDQSSLHTHAGENITSGTLADARLSANVPLLNAANNFTNANNYFVNVTSTYWISPLNSSQKTGWNGTCFVIVTASGTVGYC